MAATSAVLPAAATVHHLRGRMRARRVLRDRSLAPRPSPRPDAVMLDRDGTLIVDVPYNGDPERVEPVAGARAAVSRLRAAGLALAVVSNQSGIARGILTPRAGRRRQRAGRGPARAARAVARVPPRPRRRLRLPQASPRARTCRRRATRRRSGALRRHRRHRRRRAGGPRRGRTCRARADCGHARGRGAGRAGARRDAGRGGRPAPGGPVTHVLVARQDNAGDVLLAGPAVRAVAARADRVTFLCGPAGREAAALLPGVDEVVVQPAEWIAGEPGPVERDVVLRRVEALAAREADCALVLTSFHQSPLPLALLLRMAGVPRIGAISVDYPGSLLDVRHAVPDDIHEVERALSLAAAMGFDLPAGDDARLRVRRPGGFSPGVGHVVVHPGASVPARAWAPERHVALVDALVTAGRRVVVTGADSERALTSAWRGGARSTSAAGRRWPSWPTSSPARRASSPATPGRPTSPRPSERRSSRSSRRRSRRRAGARGASATSSSTSRCRAPAAAPASARCPDIRASTTRGRGCDGGRRALRRTGRGGGGMRVLLWHVHGSWTTAFVQGEHEYLLPVEPGRGPDGRGRAQTWDWPAAAVEVSRRRAPATPTSTSSSCSVPTSSTACTRLARRPPRSPGRLRGAQRAAGPDRRHAPSRRPTATTSTSSCTSRTSTTCSGTAGNTPTRVIEHGIVDPGDRYTRRAPSARPS